MKKKFLEMLFIVGTPIIGVAIFTFVIKGPWSNRTLSALPVYQGLLAYFSLITLGFSYTKSRRKILGIKIIPIVFSIILLPILFYVGNGANFKLVAAFVMLLFLVSAISFIKLTLNNRRSYRVFQLIASAGLPVCIVLDIEFTFAFCIVLLYILALDIYRNVRYFEDYNYFDGGMESLKSISIQAPLLMLQFFDIVLIDIIGNSKYQNYTLIMKYAAGIFNLIFSYAQFKLLFGHVMFNVKIFRFVLMAIGLALGILSFYQDEQIFFFMVAFLPLGTNISSLLIRNTLMTGITIRFALVGPLAVALYYLSLIFFGAYIEINPSIFIFLMFAAVSFPVYICWLLRLY